MSIWHCEKGRVHRTGDVCACKEKKDVALETEEACREYSRALHEYEGSDQSMWTAGFSYGVIVGKRREKGN